MPTVVLDPGHDKLTAGKRSPDGTLLEYEFNQVVVDLVEPILTKRGIKVIKTKTMNWDCGGSTAGPQGADLTRRAKVANDAKADIFVSFHSNAHLETWTTARGYEVYAFPNSASSKALADLTLKHLYPRLQKFGVPNRGRKEADFAVLRLTHMPAMLIEFEFYSCKESCALLKRQDFRLECAKGAAASILAHFGLNTNVDDAPVQPAPPKPVTPAPPTTKTDSLYRVRKTWADAGSQAGAYTDLKNAKEQADKSKLNVYDGSGKLVYPIAVAPAALPYRVRRTWANTASQIGAYNDLANAKVEADKHKYNVYDANGKLIYPIPAR